jgi:hypothetical protein
MTKTDYWPFENDANRDDPLTELRIAVTNSHPMWRYLVAFDRESEQRPTDTEAAMLASYLEEYKHHWYRGSGFQQEMEDRALDVDGGANGVIFHKWGTDDWGYRRQSWTMGPLSWPGWDRDKRYSLTELMDHMHTVGGGGPMQRWLDWKDAHVEVFA